MPGDRRKEGVHIQCAQGRYQGWPSNKALVRGPANPLSTSFLDLTRSVMFFFFFFFSSFAKVKKAKWGRENKDTSRFSL